jgi:hypothetical protein
MPLIRRAFESHAARRVARSLAVALFAIAVGVLPMAGGATAEASASGEGHNGELCSYGIDL